MVCTLKIHLKSLNPIFSLFLNNFINSFFICRNEWWASTHCWPRFGTMVQKRKLRLLLAAVRGESLSSTEPTCTSGVLKNRPHPFETTKTVVASHDAWPLGPTFPRLSTTHETALSKSLSMMDKPERMGPCPENQHACNAVRFLAPTQRNIIARIWKYIIWTKGRIWSKWISWMSTARGCYKNMSVQSDLPTMRLDGAKPQLFEK